MSGILIRGSFAYNGSGYMLTYNEQASSSTSTLWKYNHTNDSWSTVSTAPFPLPSMTHPFILETSAYVLADNKLWKFDFATNAWTLTDAQHYDAPSITTTIGGVVYGVNYNGFQRFDPVNNMWNHESSPLPYQQNQTSILFTANGRGYAIAGEKVLEYLP
jgi:hypothetical protein